MRGVEEATLGSAAFQLMTVPRGGRAPQSTSRPQSDVGSAIRRVAVVEDEFMVALALETMLENLGCEVAGIFSNGEDAVAALAAAPVDLICMDINLGRGI